MKVWISGPGQGVDSLLQAMELNDAEIERRLRAVRFEPADQDRILRVRDIVERFAESGTRTFVQYLRDSPEVAPLLRDASTVESIQALKRDHIRAMAHGGYGRDYAAQRLELALLYGDLGLEVRWFLGAYHQFLQALGIEIFKAFKGGRQEAFKTFLSLKKLAFFDIALIVDTLIFQRQQIIAQQQEAIRKLSTPVLNIRPQLLLLPVIGLIDPERGQQLTEQLLRAARESRARVVVMDVTGVPAIDAPVANQLLQTVEAARLVGAEVIISGLSAGLASTLAEIGVDPRRLNPVRDLQSGLAQAELRLSMQVNHRSSAARA